MRVPSPDRDPPVGMGHHPEPDGTVTATGPDGRTLHSHSPPATAA